MGIGVRAAAIVAVLAAVLATPLTAAAHVNRTVGPYTFFLVLIEEPFFRTNRAGFEFWVHDGDRTVEGLERTLQAVAINATRQVPLAVSAVDARGLYDVETDPEGQAFDPGSGGDWTLRLTGTVEGLSVDVSFPASFPAYPRVLSSSGSVAPVATASSPDIWVLVDGALLLGAIAWLGRKVRKRRPEASAPPTCA
jgi:hypothetical protein